MKKNQEPLTRVETAFGIILLLTVALGLVALNQHNIEKKGIKLAFVNDMELKKGIKEPLHVQYTPSDIEIKDIKLYTSESNIVSFYENEITGKNGGQIVAYLEITDKNNKTIESNEFTITVETSQEQEILEEQKQNEQKNKITRSDAKKYKYKSIDIINNHLKTPKTAEYPDSLLDSLYDWDITKSNNIITVKSYVDSQNIYGTVVRSKFTIQFQLDDKNNETITYIELDKEIIEGTYQETERS